MLNDVVETESTTELTVESTETMTQAPAQSRITKMNKRHRQQAVEKNWAAISVHRGCKWYASGTSTILCWKEPGPGSIFNFEQMLQDPLVKGNGSDWQIDICKAEGRCLYLVASSMESLKSLLWKHRLMAG